MGSIRRGFVRVVLGISAVFTAATGCGSETPSDNKLEELDAHVAERVDATSAAIADAGEPPDAEQHEEMVFKTESAPVATLSSFVVLASRSVLIRPNSSALGGNVGAGATSTAGTLVAGETLAVQPNATLGSTWGAYGRWLELDANVHAGSLFTDHLTTGSNTAYGTQNPFVAPPSLPSLGTASPGTGTTNVGANQTVTLAAGAYGAVNVGANAVLKLSGTYQFASLTTSPNVRINAQGATVIIVTGAVHAGANNTWGPTTASGLTASGFKIEVAAADSGGAAALRIDPNHTFHGLALAPAGTIKLGDNSHVTGALGAEDVDVGANAVLNWEDGLGTGGCGSCDDGNACTTDACTNGGCTHTAITCTALDQCHDIGTCNTQTGVCSNPPKANGTTCSDGNACTQTDACQAGVCSGSNPVTCSASDQCHDVGTCNAQTGVCSNPPKANGSACSDGNACTQTDTCQAGACTGANPVTCTASDQCHGAGTCDPQSGTCSNPAKPDGTACTDGNACTQIDTCVAGACVGASPVTCVALDQCHAPGTCIPATGTCTTPALPDGTLCSDGNACTQIDACGSGLCVGTSPVTCAASDQCHVPGTCNPGTGVCSNPAAPDGTSCNDANACTRTDVCTLGACTGGNPVTCTASDACHVAGTCDTSTGTCSNPAAAAGTACPDGNFCNGAETCDGSGACVSGTPPTPNPPNRCFTSACDPTAGFVYTPIAGCDPNPTTSNDVFERQASIMGKVQTQTGGAVAGFSVTVYDAPATGAPRSDVALTTAGDGSFRARLTSFPTSEPARTPPHRMIVRIDAANALPLWREVYLHVGDAVDLGVLVVAIRDPNVTVIGPSGGTATDSQHLVSVDIPLARSRRRPRFGSPSIRRANRSRSRYRTPPRRRTR